MRACGRNPPSPLRARLYLECRPLGSSSFIPRRVHCLRLIWSSEGRDDIPIFFPYKWQAAATATRRPRFDAALLNPCILRTGAKFPFCSGTRGESRKKASLSDAPDPRSRARMKAVDESNGRYVTQRAGMNCSVSTISSWVAFCKTQACPAALSGASQHSGAPPPGAPYHKAF